LNEEFPHSLRFAIEKMSTALDAIAGQSPTRNATNLERLAGRLRSSVSYSEIDQILQAGLHAYLEGIQKQCNRIHAAVNEVYVTYPIQSALET
jgi:uncharacterized alpha-E superfamily protein